MASSPIISWQIEAEKVEAVTDFTFLDSKITVDTAKFHGENFDCSHEIKRRLLLGRKTKSNLASIFKSRATTLPTKVCIVKAMVFPVVMSVQLEETFQSPLGSKEIKPVNPKENQS